MNAQSAGTPFVCRRQATQCSGLGGVQLQEFGGSGAPDVRVFGCVKNVGANGEHKEQVLESLVAEHCQVYLHTSVADVDSRPQT